MFGNSTSINSSVMGSSINSTTLNCLKEMELKNQKLSYQLSSLRTAHTKLREQYQGLYSQSSTYYQESVENKEYKNKYDSLRKKIQENEECKSKSIDSKQQPSLEQGDAYRRQFPYLSYANGIPPNTEIHIKPIDRTEYLQPIKKRRLEKTDRKKLLAKKYKKYRNLYRERNNTDEDEEEQVESDGESTMETSENREHPR